MAQSSNRLSAKKLKYFAQRAGEKAWYAIDDTVRLLQQKQNSQEIINKKEIRVVGLRRSGNHAIINWIFKQESGNPIFINHTRVLENPYRDVYRDQRLKQKNPTLKGWRCDDIEWWKRESKGNFSVKDCLIYSYEDQELERVTHPSFEKKHDFYLGRSQERFDVIILRDPFNLFASRLKGNKSNVKTDFDLMNVYSKRSLPELWLSYAKECLGETNVLTNNKTIINYNLWFADTDYRKQVAEQLKLTFSDTGFNEVTRAGGAGSSFDGTAFSGDVTKMDVLNRWKTFADDPAFQALFRDEQLIEYSRTIFGTIPGTETFLH